MSDSVRRRLMLPPPVSTHSLRSQDTSFNLVSRKLSHSLSTMLPESVQFIGGNPLFWVVGCFRWVLHLVNGFYFAILMDSWIELMPCSRSCHIIILLLFFFLGLLVCYVFVKLYILVYYNIRVYCTTLSGFYLERFGVGCL